MMVTCFSPNDNSDNSDKKYTFVFKPVTFYMDESKWLNVRDFLSKSFNPNFTIIDELKGTGIISEKCSDAEKELICSNAQRLYDIFKTRCNIRTQVLTNNVTLIDIPEIFVRINSGGIVLNFEDLTTAMITGRWVASARSFQQLIDNIEQLGFENSKGFILQACDTILNVLMLQDIDERTASATLHQHFTQISIAIVNVLRFISKIDAIRKFTYTYHNPIFIIIAYYYIHCINDRNIWREHVSNIRTFLLISLLAKDCRRLNKDLIKDLLRYVTSDDGKEFSLDRIKTIYSTPHRKKFELNIDVLLNIRMDSTIAPLVLYFIYYGQNGFKPDEMTVRDHIFPRSQLENRYIFDKKK